MKKFTSSLLGLLAAGLVCLPAPAQGLFEQLDFPDPDNTPAPVFPVPSQRQVEWMKMEFYGFSHYGYNTFLGKEWGNDTKPNARIYAPQSIPDCEQWVTAMKSAGMTGVVAVVKHHDGFCMWPTESTDFNVTNSDGVGPQVDIPKLVSEACRKHGMKFGVYLSPWDANASNYATQDYIDQNFRTQLTELLTNYGEVFEVWFDGANGGTGYYGGIIPTTKNIDKTTYYDWPNIADFVHKLQPGATVWGREFRWCGNEEGYSGRTCWSNSDIRSVQAEGNNNTGYEEGFEFIPSESDVRTSQNWFWHANESIKSAEELYKIYLETVGRNATLIMNCAPNTDGVLSDAQVRNLGQLGQLIQTRLTDNFALNATSVTADQVRDGGKYAAANATDADADTYWATNDGQTTGSVTIELPGTRTVHYVMLQEYFQLGQRVRAFNIEYSTDGSSWRSFATGTTIGYKRIMAVNDDTSSYGNGVQARFIRVNITDSRACPLINNIAVY